MITIDGSYLEGGGQIIRTSVALSALTGKPVTIENIRANRTPPGLKPQHLTGVTSVGKLCNAEIKGAELGSSKLVFKPRQIKSNHMEIDVGTAGSVTLVLQALLPAAIHSKKEFSFNIIGGTHVRWSPTYEYFEKCFCWYLEKMGAKIKSEIIRYGFYPKGGGRVKIRVQPAKLKPLKILECGKFERTEVYSLASKTLEKRKVADRQLKEFLKNYSNAVEKTESIYINSNSPGSAVYAQEVYENSRIGAVAVGERRKTSEQVGKECAERLLKEKEGESTVDSHMADQLIPYLAFYGGEFKVDSLTNHTKTNMWVCEQFLPIKFEYKNNVIKCKKQ